MNMVPDIEAEITGRGANSTVPDNPGAVDARIYMDGEPVCEVTLLPDPASNGELCPWGGSVDNWLSDPSILDGTDSPPELLSAIVVAVRNAADATPTTPDRPTFPSTMAAYGGCQTREDMPTGTIFVVPSEGVVGISWAWPISVSAAHGELHTVDSDPRDWTGSDRNETIAGAVAEAVALSQRLGYGVAANIRGA